MSIPWNWDAMPKTPEEGEAKAREWALLATSKRCRVHRIPMKFYSSRTHCRFRCPKRGCNVEISEGIGSFFEECRLKMHIAIGLMYCFTGDWSYKDARHELRSRSDEAGSAELSPGTIAAWYLIFLHLFIHTEFIIVTI
ncbi:uncharacterized protein LOC123314364 [Coccinella septempunctata]|uniref:uncharacterized protein LOC123314364 n=1 Tax=Coccinella septempunctata TaxID=41139 RepID=UPI001D062394|nr:uncharacterized protein LOC123314364 [Coccinella septempunctata]